MIVNKYYTDFNFIDFISKYYVTPTYKDNEIVNVPFIPNKQQKELIEKFLENDYVVCKKSRQVGGTALIATILLTQVLVSNSGEHFYYVGLNKMMCDDMARIISRFIKQLPLKLFNDITKPILKVNNKSQIIFANNSAIHYVTLDSLDKSMIGISNIKTIILDEIAYAKPETLLKKLYYINNMSLYENFKILTISTPTKTKENELNVFKELYNFASIKHSLYWWNDERYTENLIWVKGDDILYRKIQIILMNYMKMVGNQ